MWMVDSLRITVRQGMSPVDVQMSAHCCFFATLAKLRTKRFQSGYCAKVRAGAKKMEVGRGRG